ncbi:MAG: hypothetical protein KatS3mg105_0319 [Gemmatales bacterium]|nr:MAG: hypothetical protein KatS3mg105_0319 [Gemmatales bacterium]
MTGRSLLGVFAQRKIGPALTRSATMSSQAKKDTYPLKKNRTWEGIPAARSAHMTFSTFATSRPSDGRPEPPTTKNATLAGAWLADCDNGPTKYYMVENRDKDEQHRRLYQLAFGKRPAEELYDLQKDPHQLANVAEKADYRKIKEQLSAQLMEELRENKRPSRLGKRRHSSTAISTSAAPPRFPGFKKKTIIPKRSMIGRQSFVLLRKAYLKVGSSESTSGAYGKRWPSSRQESESRGNHKGNGSAEHRSRKRICLSMTVVAEASLGAGGGLDAENRLLRMLGLVRVGIVVETAARCTCSASGL